MTVTTLRCLGVAALVLLGACTRSSEQDALIGRWTNHHLVARQPAIVSIEFLPKGTMTVDTIDALAAAGWYPQSESTGQYEVTAPGKLKLTEELGSAVLDYRIDGAKLMLAGHGLAGVLGKETVAQELDKSD
jgi:hypothetical protein